MYIINILDNLTSKCTQQEGNALLLVNVTRVITLLTGSCYYLAKNNYTIQLQKKDKICRYLGKIQISVMHYRSNTNHDEFPFTDKSLIAEFFH